MVEIGKQNELEIVNASPQGLYLDGGDDEDILLPKAQVPENAEVGDTISVFVYCDSEDRPIATMKTPLATVGQFASLKVLEVNRKIGAFLDWGLEKDLLLPFGEQNERVQAGDQAVVYIKIDPQNGRIIASAKLRRFLSPYKPMYKVGAEVELIVCEETPLGYNAIVERAHMGLLYKSEMTDRLDYGQTLKGFIKDVRPDGKIDLRIGEVGHKRVLSVAEEIFATLVEAGGKLPFHDKSTPEEIRKHLGISKKAFKQAIGSLYKQRRIQIEDSGIKLAEG